MRLLIAIIYIPLSSTSSALVIINTWLVSTRECREDEEMLLLLGSDHIMSLATILQIAAEKYTLSDAVDPL